MDAVSPALPTPVTYRDFYIRLTAAIVAAHIITVYGESLSTFELLLMWAYYPAFLVSFVIAFGLIAYMHWITVRLDRKLDWKKAPLQRTIAQFLLGFAAPALLAFFQAWLYMRLRGVDILTTTYVTHDFQYIMLMLVIPNAYYFGYYCLLRWEQAEQRSKTISTPKTDYNDGYFMVSSGSLTIPVPFTDICYFYRKEEANYMQTVDGKTYFITSTFDDVFQKLDKRFFRVNRQLIVSFTSIAGYKNIENGKIEVRLNPTLPEPAIVSQKRAKSFREWA